jgi:uncharacterized membrane-anchored protein
LLAALEHLLLPAGHRKLIAPENKMKNKPVVVFRSMCFVFGTMAPWGFIVLGAVMSVLGTSVQSGITAAYSTAFGIFVLAVDFLLKRLANTVSKSAV